MNIFLVVFILAFAEAGQIRSKNPRNYLETINRLKKKGTPTSVQSVWKTSNASVCYNFDQFAAGTIVDNDFQPKNKQLTDIYITSAKLTGIEVRLNEENTEIPWSEGYGAALTIVAGGKLPRVYDNLQGGMNACSEISNSGLALMPRRMEDYYWGNSTYEVPGKTRKKFVAKVSQILFTLTAGPVSHFELTTSDLGDFNALGATESSKVILVAYNKLGQEVDRDEKYVHIHNESKWAHDGCSIDSVLHVSAESKVIASAGLLFESTKTIYGDWKNGKCSIKNIVTEEDCIKTVKKIKTIDTVFDPNFHIAQVCYPGAGGPDEGEGKDDPHFVGFDESTYDFNGEPGVVFNLISDDDYQLNSEFIQGSDGKTYMGKLAFLVAKNEILVQPTLDGATVEINGANVTGKQVLLDDEEGHGAGVVHIMGGVVSVSSSSFTIKVENVRWGDDLHLNFHASVQSQHLRNPHGILGQTAQFLVTGQAPNPVHLSHKNKDAAGFIEGNPLDYVVADGLWGTSFNFNRYHPHRPTQATNIYRGNRHAIASAGREVEDLN